MHIYIHTYIYTYIHTHTHIHLFDVYVTIHRVKFLIINQLDALISQIYLGMKLYMFRTVPLSIIRSSSLYTQHWYMLYRSVEHPDPARKLSANLYDMYHCCVYSEKLLTMERGTVRNM